MGMEVDLLLGKEEEELQRAMKKGLFHFRFAPRDDPRTEMVNVFLADIVRSLWVADNP
jgi:hypothetical protein